MIVGGIELVLDGERGDAAFEAAGGAEQVAGHRLGRRDGELARVVAERALDGQRLELVVERRRRAVRVDVVDLVRADPGALDRAPRITRMPPSPSSDGAVMWNASAVMP